MWQIPIPIPTIEVFLDGNNDIEMIGLGMSKEDYDAIIQHYREVENSGPETINYVPRILLLR